jgi:hypothetical protein
LLTDLPSVDFFGKSERRKSIKSALKSMHGEVNNLSLGIGVREYGSEISIDSDDDNTISVKTQRTSPLRHHTLSTHASDPATDTLGLAMSQQEPYAIVESTLPSIEIMDRWGRQDILELVRKWPDNLAANYDRVFLLYFWHYNPYEKKPVCVSIYMKNANAVESDYFNSLRLFGTHCKSLA